jgi:uncharacterized membrane protein
VTFLLDTTLDPSVVWAVLPWLGAALLLLLWARRGSGPAQARSRHWALQFCRAGVLVALVVIGLNPVHVSVIPAPLHRPEVHILLDASQSMKLGGPESRWQEGTALVRSALEQQAANADVHLHRFGERLVPVEPEKFLAGQDLAPPTDADTQLLGAFRQLASRLGREAPAGVVVVSDGRVRDPQKLNEMAAVWQRLKVPVHVVPVGRPAEGGDVAIVAAVAPAKVRKQSQVSVDVFLRSFGYAGKRVELQLLSVNETGGVRRKLSSLPVTLQDGIQPVTISFRAEPDLKRLKLHVPPLPGDLAPANNDFPIEIELDRTKIRVLFLEGSAESGLNRANANRIVVEAGEDADAPYAPFRDALLADPDVQCTVFHVPASGPPVRVLSPETAYLGSGFIKTAAELLAYDALVLANVPRRGLSDEALGWVEEWIGKRGGGLLMAGGPRSFGAGEWTGTTLEKMLPVEFAGAPDWESVPTVLEPKATDLHAVWRLFENERSTRAALKLLPEAMGRNNWLRVKPQSGTALGVQRAGRSGSSPPLLAVGAYGRGRTAALATPISGSWAPAFTRQWGEAGDNRYFARFARNLIYWLTEDSAVGRRRLVASTDKRFYRPGETVSVLAQTYDESANRTGRYRVVAILEPRLINGSELPPCPVMWPAGRPRPAGESGPLARWGEDEIQLLLDPQTKDLHLPLPLVESLANGSSGEAFKLELTAYEGQTQIDSSSLDVQILSDPFEQQNPLADRLFLAELARATGGREFTDPAALADALKALAIEAGPQTVRHTPLWSREWLLCGLLILLGLEWFCRRWLGLA